MRAVHTPVPDPLSIFPHSAAFDPAGDFEEFLGKISARWVVYLLADQADKPIQLLCVKNLRASLKRRLGGQETIGLSRRVNYRELVRRIHWRRVESFFEADHVYLEAARRVFPESYHGMVGFRPAWFIHVNPEAPFPRYTKTTDPLNKPGLLIGPIEDKHAAARLIELAEDCFDLCRYYNILIEAPHGKACAYKEMGKCPAPCDGSISMDQYRQMISRSAGAIVEPKEFLAEQEVRMRQAAELLRFEEAGKLKLRIDRASKFGQGPFRHARRLENFSFLSLQRGPRDGTAKLFLITPGQIEEIAALIDEPANPADLLRHVISLAVGWNISQLTPEGVERIGLVAHHLFSPRQSQGVFLPLDSIDDGALLKAFRDLRKQKPPEEPEGEGVVKELQAVREEPE